MRTHYAGLVGPKSATSLAARENSKRQDLYHSRRARWPRACTAEDGPAEHNDDLDVEDLKKRLFLEVSGTNRGLAADSSCKKRILEMLEELERLNPTDSPTAKENRALLGGQWKLLFTTALDILALGVIPFVQIGDIYQNIDEDQKGDGGSFYVKNIVSIGSCLNSVASTVGADSTAEIHVTAKGSISSEKRIDIRFVRASFQPKTIFGYDGIQFLDSLQIPFQSPVGFIETTYLDKDLRIARAPGPEETNLYALYRCRT